MQFKTKPFAHQLEEFESTCALPLWARFWDQGTGKTKTTIDEICYQYQQGTVDAAVVVAPNGVHRNWVDEELPTHCSCAYSAFAFRSKKSVNKSHQQQLKQLLQHTGLAVLAISYSGAMTKRGKQALKEFLKQRKVFMVLDESHYIKTPSAKRTRALLRAAPQAVTRRILTGTPSTQGAFDVYSQLRFLRKDFWKHHLGISTFTEFKTMFGVFTRGYNGQTGREFKQLVDYKNLSLLASVLKVASSRVTKEEVLDLPPKMYTKRFVQLSKEQAKYYKQLKQEMIAWLDSGQPVIADLAITQLLRMQQVLSGYLPNAEGDLVVFGGQNNRLQALVDALKQRTAPTIVWARFRYDIDLIMHTLQKEGITAVRYDGAATDDEKAAAVKAFQKDRTAKVFVGNPAAGATGITLTAAKYVDYYSNSFNLTDRLQSEDRAHRIGQSNAVLYTDYIAENTVDERIVQALRDKKDIAAQITGDNIKEWI